MPESLICSRISEDRIITKEVIIMSKLLISTQVRENYGAHQWDGEGICPQYWKNKGGNDYFVMDVNINKVEETFEGAVAQCECSDEYYTEQVINWEVVPDDYLTESERNQLHWEGKIMYPAKLVSLLA